MLNVPFTGEKVEEQLDFITSAGLHLPRMFDNEDGITLLSEIFDWYASDFINDVSRTQSLKTQNNILKLLSGGSWEQKWNTTHMI